MKPEIDPDEVATDLMLWHARHITSLEIRNAIGDHDGSADLSPEEFDTLISQVQVLIDTADITIDTGAA